MRVAINRFEPFRELAAVRLASTASSTSRGPGDDTLTRADWVPAVDVYETDQHELVLKAELPGIRRGTSTSRSRTTS
jgi:HSP20 family molecular chaperone IbpA